MKFSAQRARQVVEFPQPARNVLLTHPSLAAMLLVPIDRHNWIDWRKVGIALARVVVHRSEAAHGPIGNIRSMVIRDFVMPLRDEIGLAAKSSQRPVQPILE